MDQQTDIEVPPRIKEKLKLVKPCFVKLHRLQVIKVPEGITTKAEFKKWKRSIKLQKKLSSCDNAKALLKENDKDDKPEKSDCLIPCVFCGVKIDCYAYKKRRKHLLAHQKSMKAPFSCDLLCKCGKSFLNLNALENHLNIHVGIKPYRCAVCEKSFTGERSFYDHRRIHKNPNSTRCDICSKKFSSKGCLDRHKLKIHEICETSVLNSSFTKKNLTKKSCVFCGMHVIDLNRHIRMHTEERPYFCPNCDMTFTCSFLLKCHIEKHHLRIRYKCSICQKSFYSADTLKKHRIRKQCDIIQTNLLKKVKNSKKSLKKCEIQSNRTLQPERRNNDASESAFDSLPAPRLVLATG